MRVLVLLTLAMLAAPPTRVTAQEGAPPAAAESLIRREELRETLQAAIDSFRRSSRGPVRNDLFVRAADGLLPLGEEIVPFLVNEVEQAIPDTYFFATYTLGRLGEPSGEPALRDAIVNAEAESSDYAVSRKAWACYALGLMGHVDALDLLNEGRHMAGIAPMHRGMSTLEATAFQTVPGSIPALLAQLERYDDELDPLMSHRALIVKALGRIGDPGALPELVELIEQAHPMLQQEAAYALGRIATEEATTALLGALEAPDIRTRRAAALALDETLPLGRLDVPWARLDEEEDAVLRGSLYRVVARAGGRDVLPALVRQAGRPDSTDRLLLTRAIGLLGVPEGVPFLRSVLGDSAGHVAVAAVLALGATPGPEAAAVLRESVSDPRPNVAQVAIDELTDRGDPLAGPLVAHRLIDQELAGVVDDGNRRIRAVKLARSLAALGDAARLDELVEATERQYDPLLIEPLREVIETLTTVRRNRSKVKRWIRSLAADSPDVRRAAYRALGDAGDPRAAEPLVEAFGRVAQDEGLEILRALGTIDADASRTLIRRVLIEPAFDPLERAQLRDMAAWSARRLGGPAIDALRESVERRSGQDFHPLVYLAVADADRGLAVLERWRFERMRYVRWTRGLEQERLDRLARLIRAGYGLEEFEVPPNKLALR